VVKILAPKSIAEQNRVEAEMLNCSVIRVMPNAGRPVTHWLVVGPFVSTGEATEMEGQMDFMFEDYDDAIRHAEDMADGWAENVTVIVSLPDPIA